MNLVDCASYGSVEPLAVVVRCVTAPFLGAEHNFLEGRTLSFVYRHRQTKIEKKAHWKRAWIARNVVRTIQRLVSAELVEIEQASNGQVVVREVDLCLVPVGVPGFDGFQDSSHAVVDRRAVFEADDDVPDEGFGDFAREEIEVFSYCVSTHENGHIHAKAVVGIPDGFHDIVGHDVAHELVGHAAFGQVSFLPDVGGELQDLVVGCVPVDLFQSEVDVIQHRRVLHRRELSVVADGDDGDVEALKVVEQPRSKH